MRHTIGILATFRCICASADTVLSICKLNTVIFAIVQHCKLPFYRHIFHEYGKVSRPSEVKIWRHAKNIEIVHKYAVLVPCADV